MVDVGILWRAELADGIRAAAGEFDFIELTAEHFIGPNRPLAREAQRIAGRWPVLVHGLDLSLGTAADPDLAETRERSDLVQRVGALAFSEHVSFTRVPGRAIGQLTALPFTGEAVDALARRAAALALDVPLRLENIAYYHAPGGEMTEAQFLRAVLERTGAEMLLDANNLRANAANHGYDAEAFLDALPMERVAEMHIAGGGWREGMFIDTHGAAPDGEMWRIFGAAAARSPNLRHVTLEWDHTFPPFERIIDVVRRARRVTEAACAAF